MNITDKLNKRTYYQAVEIAKETYIFLFFQHGLLNITLRSPLFILADPLPIILPRHTLGVCVEGTEGNLMELCKEKLQEFSFRHCKTCKSQHCAHLTLVTV